jgi:hypothetical protein
MELETKLKSTYATTRRERNNGVPEEIKPDLMKYERSARLALRRIEGPVREYSAGAREAKYN